MPRLDPRKRPPRAWTSYSADGHMKHAAALAGRGRRPVCVTGALVGGDGPVGRVVGSVDGVEAMPCGDFRLHITGVNPPGQFSVASADIDRLETALNRYVARRSFPEWGGDAR